MRSEREIDYLIEQAEKRVRESCATIAATMPYGASFSEEYEKGFDNACKQIAAAIRANG